MRGSRDRRLTRVPLVAGAVLLALVLLSSGSSAQFPPILSTPTPQPPTPTPTPTPTFAPPPSPTPTEEPLPTLPPEPTLEPDEKSPKPTKDGDKEKEVVKPEDELPAGLEEELVVPVLPRTRPRNTVELVRILEPLTELGVPLEEVLIQGMGRFPVAGLAHYFDDWLNPRYSPKPHLHHGLDIFADFGTPIRAPDRGVVTSLPEAGAGGIAVWVRGSDATSYYFAHMLERVEGIRVGQRVDIGTVLGFVGDTGNAKGGSPHLHFELHPGGGGAVPPKPTVDAWLDEALTIAPKWVEAQRASARTKSTAPGQQTSVSKDRIETSMLLTLLDPVGGSVGMLPSVQLRPRHAGVSDRLLSELIRQRIHGGLFMPLLGVRLND